MSEGDLFIAGVVAYAAEGTKKKPWQTSRPVGFTNSDPRMIRLFLRWLSLMGIDRSSLSFRVSIHRGADVASALRFLVGGRGSPPGTVPPNDLEERESEDPAPKYRARLPRVPRCRRLQER